MYQVYIISSGKKKYSPMKIGMTRNIERRLSQLQTGSPYQLRVVALFPCSSKRECMELERFLHEIYFSSRLCGEWFLGKDVNLARASYEFERRYNKEIPLNKVNIKSGSEFKHDEEVRRVRRVNLDLRKKNNNLGKEINRLNEKIAKLKKELESPPPCKTCSDSG